MRIKSKKDSFNDSSSISLIDIIASKLLKMYENCEEKFEGTFLYSCKKGLSLRVGVFFNKIKRAISYNVENSLILNFLNDLSSALLSKSLRFYGVILFFYALFHFLFTVFKRLNTFIDMNFLTRDNIDFVLFSVFALICASILMTSQKSLASQIIHSRFLSSFFFDFLFFDKNRFINLTATNDTHTLPVIIGIILGIISAFTSPLYLFGGISAYFLVHLIMKKPENGIAVICLGLPFLDDKRLFSLICIVLVSYLFKVLRLKRVFKITLMDYIFFALIFIILLCGFNGVKASDSLVNSLVIGICIFFGFIVSNCIKSTELVEKIIRILLFSFTVSAFLAICIFFIEKYNLASVHFAFSFISDLLVSIPFDNKNIFEVLVLFVPLSLSKCISGGQKNNSSSIVSFGMLVFALILSFDTAIWFTLVFAIAVYMCILNPKLILPLALIFGGFLMFVGFLPNLVGLISSFLGNIFKVGFDFDGTVYANSFGLKLCSDTFFFGFGSGRSTINQIIVSLYGTGYSGISDKMSFIVTALLQYGVVGIFLMVLSFITFIAFSLGLYYNESYTSRLKPYIASSVASVCAIFLKCIFFPTFTCIQTLIVLSLLIYICMSIKQSIHIEYVPSGIETFFERH